MSAAGLSTETEPQTGPQVIRITNHGKMKVWVAFALKFLEEHEDRPIVLHTLPLTALSATTANGPPELIDQPQRSTGSVLTATRTVPRLISVVEIIKREYIKILALKHSPRLLGLHQYNEIGSLEGLGLTGPPDHAEDSRGNELAMALSGKNYVRQKQTPYMRITLSLSELPELVGKGTTYQPPHIRKLTKSAKARAKKRERASKAKEAAEEGPANDGGDAILAD